MINKTSKIKSFYKTVCSAIAGVSCLASLSGCGVNVEEEAKPLVEQVIQENRLYTVRCERIRNLKETSEDCYSGEAVFSITGVSREKMQEQIYRAALLGMAIGGRRAEEELKKKEVQEELKKQSEEAFNTADRMIKNLTKGEVYTVPVDIDIDGDTIEVMIDTELLPNF